MMQSAAVYVQRLSMSPPNTSIDSTETTSHPHFRRPSRVTFSEQPEEHEPDHVTQSALLGPFQAVNDPPQRPRSANSVRSRQSRCSSIVSTRTKESARTIEEDHFDGLTVRMDDGAVFNFGRDCRVNLVRNSVPGAHGPGGISTESIPDMLSSYHTEPFPSLPYQTSEASLTADDRSSFPTYVAMENGLTRRSSSPSPSYHSRLDDDSHQQTDSAEDTPVLAQQPSSQDEATPPSTPRAVGGDVPFDTPNTNGRIIAGSESSTPAESGEARIAYDALIDPWASQQFFDAYQGQRASFPTSQASGRNDADPRQADASSSADKVHDLLETLRSQPKAHSVVSEARAPGPLRPKIHAKAASEDSGIVLSDGDKLGFVLAKTSSPVVEEAVLGSGPPPPMDTENDISIHYTRLVRSIDMTHRSELVAKDDEIRRCHEDNQSLRREISLLQSEVLRTKNQVKALSDPAHVSRRLESTSGESQAFSFPPLALNHVRTLKVALKRRATKLRRSIEDELGQSNRDQVTDSSAQTDPTTSDTAVWSPVSSASEESPVQSSPVRAGIVTNEMVPKADYDEMAAALNLAQLEGRVAQSEIDGLLVQVSELQESVGFWVARSRTLTRQQQQRQPQQMVDAGDVPIDGFVSPSELAELTRSRTQEKMAHLAQRIRDMEDAAQVTREMANARRDQSRLESRSFRVERLRHELARQQQAPT